MDIVSIAKAIDEKIKILVACRKQLADKGNLKAKTISDYEKAMALTTIGLKNGRSYNLEGEDIINPPVTIIDKIAKGICYSEKLAMELAETDYKSLLTFMNCVQAEMNALQSLNRYLDNK